MADMMFGGAAALVADNGGTADTGATGGDDAADTPVLPGGDAGTSDDTPSDTPSDTPTDDQADTTDKGDGADKSGDARALLGEARKQLAELRKVNPKLADFAQKSIFKSQEFEKLFPTVKEAQNAKAVLEELGGEEGIVSLRQGAEALQAVDSSIEQGNPQVLDDMFRDFPEGTAKLVPAAVERLSKINPQAYEQLQSGMVDTFLQSKNVYSHVTNMLASIEGGDQAKALEAVKQLSAFLNHYSKNAPKADSGLEAERTKFNTEKQTYEQTKATEAQATFTKSVATMTDAVLIKQAKDIITGLVPKGTKLPDATVDAILKDAFASLNSTLGKDANYQKRWSGLLKEAIKTGDTNRMHKFVMSHASPKLLDALKASKGKFVIGAIKAAAKPGAPGAVIPKGVINRKPSFEESGLDKTSYLNGLGAKKITARSGQVFQWA
jgi:hypothetical protein